MSFLDVFCNMPFVRQIFPDYSKNEMLCCMCYGKGSIWLGQMLEILLFIAVVTLFLKLDSILRSFLDL